MGPRNLMLNQWYWRKTNIKEWNGSAQVDTNFYACPSFPNQQYSHSPTLSPPHAQYLNECFVKRIGLQPDERTEVDITTFDEVHVAKGYNRILPTWQGYFIELDESDIIKDNLWWNESPEDGEESWICPGLKIFTLTKPDNRRTPQAHRFALRTPPDSTGRCNPLQLHKWYIDAYQARFIVGNLGRSLNSRTMAADIKKMWPELCHPREKDVRILRQGSYGQQSPTRKHDNHRTHPERNAIPKTHQPKANPLIVPTPFTPMPLFNQLYPPPGTQIPNRWTGWMPLPQHSWPRATATQQQPVAADQRYQNLPHNNQYYIPPPTVQQHVPAPIYNQAYAPPPMLPQQVPTATYAQVANPQYHFNPVTHQTHHSSYPSNLQQTPLPHVNNMNIQPRGNDNVRAPTSA